MSVPHGVQTASEGRSPRRFTRQKIESLVYADLGPDNGGFPINISEDGIAFQGVRPLEKNQSLTIKFKLPGVEKAVAGTAEIVWLNESGKGGGLQFVELPEDSRQIVMEWLSLRRPEVGRTDTSTVIASRIETKELPPTAAIPLAPEHVASSSQATAMAEPSPAPSDSTSTETQPIAPVVSTEAEPLVSEIVSVPHPREVVDLTRPYRVVLVNDEKSRALLKSIGAAVIILITLAIVYGVIPAGFRGTPRRPMVSGNASQPDTQSAGSTAPALTDEQVEVATSSTGQSNDESTKVDSPDSNAAASRQANETMQTLPDAAQSEPAHDTETTASRPSASVRKTTSIVPFSPAEENRSRSPAIVPATSESSIPPPRNPISEPTNVHPVPEAATEEYLSAAGTPAVAAKPPENSANTTGSIEIISDPYPSFRVPPEWKGWVSRPGTSLHIGRRISGVDPLYPKDALQQRMAGTVKLHVLIGRDGGVEKVNPTEGGGPLAEAAADAIQEWRYEPTLLGGAAIEAEEDITVIFRLVSPTGPVN